MQGSWGRLGGGSQGECEQYSRVGNCVISEVPGVPTDESGWVFLEFERVESASR